MALAKKGSRLMEVEDIRYRWTVSPDSGYMWLVVERESANGCRLLAMMEYNDAMGLDGRSRQGRQITPATVRHHILSAMSAGWDPAAGGPPFTLR